MKRNRFLHGVLALVLTFGLLFSVGGAPANAAKAGKTNLQRVQLDKASAETNDASDESSVEDVKDSGHVQLNGFNRNGIWVTSITVYPGVVGYDSASKKATILYDPDISDQENYLLKSSTTTYEFTKTVKDNLIARLKNKDDVDATGWYVVITFFVETAERRPAQLYLNLNGEKLPEFYHYPVQNDESVSVDYVTDSDNSNVTGYIDYGGRYAREFISTGTRYYNQ